MTKEEVIEDILKYLNNKKGVMYHKSPGTEGLGYIFPKNWKVELVTSLSDDKIYEETYNVESHEIGEDIVNSINHVLNPSKSVCHQSRDDTAYHITVCSSYDAFL